MHSNNPWEHAVCGMGAGILTSLGLHPLDVIKTRFQVHTNERHPTIPRYRNTVHAFASIVRREGPRGLYSGLAPALLGNAVAWGIFFYSYQGIKGVLRGTPGEHAPRPSPLGFREHLVAATCAGSATMLVTNPLWFLKTRMQLQTQDARVYASLRDAVRKVAAREGVAGFYKGIVPGLWNTLHGGVQFGVYEQLKHVHPRPHDMRPHEELAMGAASKVVASVVTQPLSVVRTRLQQHVVDGVPQYRGMVDGLVKIARGEGVRGFYRGLGPTLLRVTPQSAFTLLAYEELLKVVRAVA